MNEIETEFRDATLNEISKCPLLKFFRWGRALSESKRVLYSPHWRADKPEHRAQALDSTKHLIRSYIFALLRAELYTASDPADNLVPWLKSIAGPERVLDGIEDRYPLRYNENGDLISPAVVGSGVAQINPEWTEAKYELIIQAQEYEYDWWTVSQDTKLEVRLGNDDAGYLFVVIKLCIPVHSTEGVKKIEVSRERRALPSLE